jgi:hypothetical protein
MRHRNSVIAKRLASLPIVAIAAFMPRAKRTIARVQTGVRMEKRLLLVLKALAGTLDLSPGDLLDVP